MKIGGVGNSDVSLPVAVEQESSSGYVRSVVTLYGRIVSRHWDEGAAVREAHRVEAARALVEAVLTIDRDDDGDAMLDCVGLDELRTLADILLNVTKGQSDAT